MQANLISIGNSKGIILPAPLLKALGITERLSLEIEQDALLLSPVPSRAAWEPAFEEMAALGDDQLLMDSVLERSEERRVGKECRSRWSPYH